jgi:hypothetical protein
VGAEVTVVVLAITVFNAGLQLIGASAATSIMNGISRDVPVWGSR